MVVAVGISIAIDGTVIVMVVGSLNFDTLGRHRSTCTSTHIGIRRGRWRLVFLLDSTS